MFRVNTALRACVAALFGNELKARVQAEKEAKAKITRGEDGGIHDKGYEVLSKIDEEVWSKVNANTNHMSVRRSIVLDADDQR